MCEVCHKPVIIESELPPEIQDKIYRPGRDENYGVEVDVQDEEDDEPIHLGEIEIESENGEPGQ